MVGCNLYVNLCIIDINYDKANYSNWDTIERRAYHR